MTFPEFGRVIEKAPERKAEGTYPEFGKIVEMPSRPRSLLGAPVKGAIKEAADIAELFQKIPLPKGPLKPEKLREFAEEKFPTQPKEAEKFLERAGRVGTSALLSPGKGIVKGAQILAGTVLGHTAEKLGAPSLVQAIAESLPFFYSGGKRIPLKTSQKNLGEFLRKQGLTENEITPLLKTPEQLARWSKLASKGKKSRELMESIYQKTGNIYDSVISEGKNLPPLNATSKEKLLREMTPIIESMPHKYRSLIEQDIQDFLTKGRAGAEDIINLDKDINAVIGAEKGGKAIVGKLKGPLSEALNSINPSLSNDYQLAKDFYRTRINVAGHILNKKQVEDLIDVGEFATLGAGLFNRDIGLIGKVMGVSGARKLAREMLINPRLQNISIRIGEALKKNKFTLAEKYLNQFKDEVGKEDPELASSIDKIQPKVAHQ